MSQLPPLPEPRFIRGESGRTIIDTDFMHDALMKIDGDFGTDAERIAYADGLLSLLNAEQARAALLADAMRWRFMRDKKSHYVYATAWLGSLIAHKDGPCDIFSADEVPALLDAAIDAAMKGQA